MAISSMRLMASICLTAALTGCIHIPGYSTVPLVLQLPSGEDLKGGVTTRLLSGSFQASDGRKTCSGTFNADEEDGPVSVFMNCSTGEQGRGTGLQLNALSGSGRLVLSSGRSFVFQWGDAIAITKLKE